MIAQAESPIRACTSLPQEWHKPRGGKINAVPISSVVVALGKRSGYLESELHVPYGVYFCFGVAAGH